MALAYFDSSAFVKLLVEEDGSATAAAVWDGCDAALASRIAYPEVRAALAAAGRARRLTPGDQDRAERAWEGFWAATRPVELTAELAEEAGGLAGRHALRGADAVHLASLLVLGIEDAVFVAWDRRLREGARAVGAALVPAP